MQGQSLILICAMATVLCWCNGASLVYMYLCVVGVPHAGFVQDWLLFRFSANVYFVIL